MKEKKEDITGIILAGGKSTRMGTDKALLSLGKRTVIETVSELMTGIFKTVLISAGESEQYRFLGLDIVPDIHRNYGPISGIHASLFNSLTDKNFFLSCDLPLMSEEIILFVIEYPSSKPVIVPTVEGRIQPLCGVYNKSLIPLMEELITDSAKSGNEKGKNSASMIRLLEKSDAEILDIKTVPFYDPNLFFNMNTTSDFEFIRKKLSE